MKKEQSPFSLLDKELLAQIKGIHIKARHLVNESFAGEYQSAFRGRGMEFDEIREYSIGDDVRNIDWNVTARSRKPYIKVFRDERELTVLFAVDVSASSRFGGRSKLKKQLTAEVAALLAYTALKNNDKVGLLIFSDQVEHYIPPKKGRGHAWSLIRDILTFEPKSKRTDIGKGLEFINRVQKSKAIVFLASDFLGGGYERTLRVTSKRHDLVALKISDPLEFKLPQVGYVEWQDAETGESLLINTNHLQNVKNFEKRSRLRHKKLIDFFRSFEIDMIDLSTDRPYMSPIIQFFKKRESQYR